MASESDRPPLPSEPMEPDGPRVGVDEWVASADRLREGPTGVAGALRRAGEVVTPPIQLAIFAGLAATVPFWLGTGAAVTPRMSASKQRAGARALNGSSRSAARVSGATDSGAASAPV